MKQSNYDGVLNVFFDNPNGKFYIREIARITKLNPNTVLNITNELEKEGLIKRDKKKHIVELSAEINEKFIKLKKVNNIGKIYGSGLIELLIEKFSPEAVVMIGSYTLGEDIKNSDIDVVVLTKKDYENIDLTNIENKLNRDIHLIITDYDKISEEFYINLINGIVLYGAINKK